MTSGWDLNCRSLLQMCWRAERNWEIRVSNYLMGQWGRTCEICFIKGLSVLKAEIKNTVRTIVRDWEIFENQSGCWEHGLSCGLVGCWDCSIRWKNTRLDCRGIDKKVTDNEHNTTEIRCWQALYINDTKSRHWL